MSSFSSKKVVFVHLFRFKNQKPPRFFEEFSLFVSANIRCDAAIAVPDLAQIELVMFLRGTMGNKNFSVRSYSSLKRVLDLLSGGGDFRTNND